MAAKSLNLERLETERRATRKTNLSLSSYESLVRLVVLLEWQTARNVHFIIGNVYCCRCFLLLLVFCLRSGVKVAKNVLHFFHLLKG